MLEIFIVKYIKNKQEITNRLIVGSSYNIISLIRPGAKIWSRRISEIESLKVV